MYKRQIETTSFAKSSDDIERKFVESIDSLFTLPVDRYYCNSNGQYDHAISKMTTCLYRSIWLDGEPP